MSKSRGTKGNKKETPSDTFDHSDLESGLEEETPQGELNHGQTNLIGPANLQGDSDSTLEELKVLIEQMDINNDEICKAFIAQQVTFDSEFDLLMTQSITLGNRNAWTIMTSILKRTIMTSRYFKLSEKC